MFWSPSAASLTWKNTIIQCLIFYKTTKPIVFPYSYPFVNYIHSGGKILLSFPLSQPTYFRLKVGFFLFNVVDKFHTTYQDKNKLQKCI